MYNLTKLIAEFSKFILMYLIISIFNLFKKKEGELTSGYYLDVNTSEWRILYIDIVLIVVTYI